jgi:hypothetical protein
MTRSLLAILLLGVASAPAAPGEEAPYLPGGEEVRKAVEARRGKTELSKLAAAMKPGSWAELKTDMPKGLWSAPQPSKGLHIGTWSDDGQWDSRTGQFLFFGVRQARKLVAYSEEKNAWRNIPFDKEPDAPELLQKFGHQYGGDSLDPERSRLFTGGACYDIRTGKWSKLPPCTLGSKAMTWEYFSAMDGLLFLSRQPEGVLCFYSEEKKAWSSLGKAPLHGYHSQSRHNPFRQEVLFGGGNDSRTVVILSKDGKIKRMKDFPDPVLTVRRTIVTVDPLSGRYLFMGDKRLIEFDSEKDEYRLVDDFTKTPWPFGHYDSPLVAYIPEYGVTMWADSKVFLYKHDAGAGGKVAEPEKK